MKYRVLWSRQPMSPIEEEEEEEEGEDENGSRSYIEDVIMSDSSTMGCYSSTVTPYGSLMPPPGLECPTGVPQSPEQSASLTDTLNHIIDTATINIVGFEESFAVHLSTEACSLMWHLCQVYGKTRMAIDLVERELLNTKQEMAHVKHIYEDLSEAESELCTGIAKSRYIRESIEEETTVWKQEYRRWKDENTMLKLKANRYQLHLDQMERSCSDTSHQNYAVKAFLAICREKERARLHAKLARSRHPGRAMTGGDNVVNGKYCNSPRRHCPKVTLCLPRPGESECETSPLGFPPAYKKQISLYDKKIMQKITSAAPVNPDRNRQDMMESPSIFSQEDTRINLPHYTGSTVVTPDIPSKYRKLAQAELAEADEELRSGAKTADVDDVGYVIIPEFELTPEEERYEDMMERMTPGSNSLAQPEVTSDLVTTPDVKDEKREDNTASSTDSADTDSGGTMSAKTEEQGSDTADDKKSESESDPETEVKNSGSSDDLANSVRDSVSTYLAESSGTKEPERAVHKQTINPNVQKVSDTTLASPCHKGTGRYPQLPPFMMARGYSLQKEVPHCTSQSWSSCTTTWETCRCQKCRRSRSQNLQRPATCTAIHNEKPAKSRVKERASSVMTGKQTTLPPLPCPQHGNKYTASTTISNESKSVIIKDRKPPTCFPALCKPEKQTKLKRVKSMVEKPSEKLRAQMRSFSRQVLPVVSSQEATNTRFHQVLLIRSCSSEKLEKPNIHPTYNMHDSTCTNVLTEIRN